MRLPARGDAYGPRRAGLVAELEPCAVGAIRHRLVGLVEANAPAFGRVLPGASALRTGKRGLEHMGFEVLLVQGPRDITPAASRGLLLPWPASRGKIEARRAVLSFVSAWPLERTEEEKWPQRLLLSRPLTKPRFRSSRS